jgi:methylenetetrahydrofolate reductase (NADPH)
MFFNNEKYFSFVSACREIGINVPIIPGLKPIYSKKQLTILPKTFHIDLPISLSEAVISCKSDEDVEKVGQEWLLEQSIELKKAGVPVLHYYTLGRPQLVANVVKELV